MNRPNCMFCFEISSSMYYELNHHMSWHLHVSLYTMRMLSTYIQEGVLWLCSNTIRVGTPNWYQFRTASCVNHAPRDQCSHDHNSTRITFHMNTIHLSLKVLHTKPHGWIQSLIGIKWQQNNIKKPLLSRHNRQGTVQSIAYPSRRKRPSNRHHTCSSSSKPGRWNNQGRAYEYI